MANSNNESRNPCFRWFHISDLHVPGDARTYSHYKRFIQYILSGESDSYDSLEKIGIEGIIEGYGGIDSIIITGDCFNRGNLSDEAEDYVLETIGLIYGACSKSSDWDWNANEPMDRLCYCPGNHDLAREENVRNRKGQYGLIHRKDVISEAASSKSAFLSIGDSSKRELVVNRSFELFHSTMQKLTTKDGTTSSTKYISDRQIICFYPDATKTGDDPKFIVIGLNTALLAGQVATPADNASFEDYASTKKDEIEKCIQAGNYSGALSKAKELEERHQVTKGKKIVDEGKMCLPEEGAYKTLCSKLQSGNFIPILFGHHGIDFFNSEAQNELNVFFKNFHVPVYLCGHAHQMHDSEIEGTSLSRFPNRTCLEVTAGGLFWDETTYNQIGFSIGTIELTDFSSYIITIDHYTCVQFHGDTGTGRQNAGIWTKGTTQKKIDRQMPTNRGATKKANEINCEEVMKEKRHKNKDNPSESKDKYPINELEDRRF